MFLLGRKQNGDYLQKKKIEYEQKLNLTSEEL